MPFTVTEYKFGRQRGLMVYHDEKKHHIDILPAYGALPARIDLFGHELTEPLDSASQLEEEHFYRNFWLFPFQNRVADGTYTFEGRKYQLPVNEEERNNALHGFFQDLKMTEVNHQVQEGSVEVDIFFTYDGGMEGYPFPFECRIIYLIRESGKLDLHYEIVNTGDSNMPVTWGWHPYFQLDGERKDWKIASGPLLKQPLNERNLPEGDFVAVEKSFDLAHELYDDCFRFCDPPYRVSLESANQLLIVDQDANMPYVQIFTPPRNSVAIEPVSSAIDAFNSGEGLRIMAPSEQINGKIVLDFSLK